MIEDPNRPAWAGNYFVGVPAPAGAITVLLPIYVQFLGLPHLDFAAPVTFLYTVSIAFLMVSRLPVLSGKRVGKRVSPEMVLPVFVLIVLFFALLISYPWEVLTIGTVIYLATLPLGWRSYREAQRKTAAAGVAAGNADQAVGAVAVATGAGEPQPSPPLAADHPPQSERPTRLN
jgi:CDP-diacylglycerol--serine O-phosphatidyltransferase